MRMLFYDMKNRAVIMEEYTFTMLVYVFRWFPNTKAKIQKLLKLMQSCAGSETEFKDVVNLVIDDLNTMALDYRDTDRAYFNKIIKNRLTIRLIMEGNCRARHLP